jgi:acetyl esterase/lipase
MLGGSAGGHVAASAGTLFDSPEGRTGSPMDQVSGRPDFLVLIFPVLTMRDPHAHAFSRANLLGANPPSALIDLLSLESRVTKDTPPTFLVHSSADDTVPVENSLMYYAAMRKAGAPIELHLYPVGPHGSGMSSEFGPISLWPGLCEAWMRFNHWLPPRPSGN